MNSDVVTFHPPISFGLEDACIVAPMQLLAARHRWHDLQLDPHSYRHASHLPLAPGT